MRDNDLPGAALRSLDAARTDFIHICGRRYEAGAEPAGRDIEQLLTLAMDVVEASTRWALRLATLEVAAVAPLEPGAARRRLIETVFDEALHPEATAILIAAAALSEAGR